MSEVLPSPTPNTVTVTADDAIKALIAAGGKFPLAAERLRCTQSALLAALAGDLDSGPQLQAALRTLTLLKAFDLLNQTQLVLTGLLHELEPGEAAKLYNSLLTGLTGLTALQPSQQAQPLDALGQVLKALPPSAREALLALSAGNPNT